METKNNIETKIEQDHFGQVFKDFLGTRFNLEIIRNPGRIKENETRRRDYNLMMDYLGIDTTELSEDEVSTKYCISKNEFDKITTTWARQYIWNARKSYINGTDYVNPDEMYIVKRIREWGPEGLILKENKNERRKTN